MSSGLIVIGENFNATRKVRAISPRLVTRGTKTGLAYTSSQGERRVLDVTEIYPAPGEDLSMHMIPHIAHAMRTRDHDYVSWVIQSQKHAGAHIIDICVDEISVEPEERHEWMRWLVKTAQSVTDLTLAIDSSDPDTIRAGIEVYDRSKSRPAINSTNLEPGRRCLVELARKTSALLFANASGAEGMPQNAAQRVENLSECMALMDGGNIPIEDRYLDPLVFPIGAGNEYGNHYLEAVGELRNRFPAVHIFGGHSNISFGLPRRKLLNQAFLNLSILAGCDTIMVDPLMNPPREAEEFKLALDALTGKDEYSMRYLQYYRSNLVAAHQGPCVD